MDIKEKLKIVPNLPGCYLMKDKFNNIIYVGKAKNLSNRLKSYFTGSHNLKTTLLVSNIFDFEFVVTKTELESLILELNLIKEHDPKYNIKLTDDKTYPFIEITNELYPKVTIVRKKKTKNAKMFGPYPNVLAARNTVKLINRIYPFRKCYKLPKKTCLYYHLNQCLAPCVFKDVDYSNYIKKVTKFLNGNNSEILEDLKKEMEVHSNNLEYEKAIEIRDIINSINQTTEKQNIILNDIINRDIIGFYYDQDDISIQIFFMRHGSIVQTHKEIIGYISDPISEISNYISMFYLNQNNIIPKEVFTKDLDNEILSKLINTKFITPKIGDKKKLLDLAFDNAKIELETNKELYRNKLEKIISGVDSLKELLNLEDLRRIECFDNSHIFGANNVSAMICYINGRPSKKDYRKYIIKSVENIDDYKSFEEVIYRRYYKVLLENLELPNLIIIDGGLGQVNVALKIINSLNLNIPIIGLKKNNKHQTYSIIYNNNEIVLSSKMPYYKLLLEIQEEVHRFAISFHRNKRGNEFLKSVLDDIEGIGSKRKLLLLKTFKTLDNMKNASFEEYYKIGFKDELIIKIKEKLETLL